MRHALFALIPTLVVTTPPAPAAIAVPAGYPKQVVFRNETPAMLEADQDKIQMVVSDHSVWTRGYGHEAFAERFPEKPVLVHVGGDFISANAYSPRQMLQDRGLADGEVKARYLQTRKGAQEILAEDFLPIPGFLGYWVYEAGVNAVDRIDASQAVTIRVPDAKRFAPRPITPPSSAGELRLIMGDSRVARIVVICPRGEQGELRWRAAELAEVVDANDQAGTLRLRRFNMGKGFAALPAGCYVAASAPVWDRIVTWGHRNLPASHPFHNPVWQFFMPNFTPLCPVDPETGLNAAQWFARHFLERKKKYYPHSGGYALDVTTDTFFPKPHHIAAADLNHDGMVDRGFFNGVSWWALGMHDFVYYMRAGVPGVFEGMGSKLLVTWDATDNMDQRFFHLLNGAEFEHTMIHGEGWGPMGHLYSSNLDRLLLWGERAVRPNVTFVSNKLPDEAYHGGTKEEFAKSQAARPAQSLRRMRLDLASACMATGYFNKYAGRATPATLSKYPGAAEQVARYGAPLLQDYDELQQGTDRIRGWLGQPLSPPVRYRHHLGPLLYRFDEISALPTMVSTDGVWKAPRSERRGNAALVLKCEATGPFVSADQTFTLTACLPLSGVELEEMAEYAVSFSVRGSSPYGEIAPRYRPIPRNINLRLRVGERVAPASAPAYYQKKGYYQECTVFEDERRVELTLQAPAGGSGVLEICISESPGTVEISNLEIRRGCADVVYREFEHGLVVLNGSSNQGVKVDLHAISPQSRFRRLKGSQDPVHNNGEPVEQFLLNGRDGLFLKRLDHHQVRPSAP